MRISEFRKNAFPVIATFAAWGAFAAAIPVQSNAYAGTPAKTSAPAELTIPGEKIYPESLSSGAMTPAQDLAASGSPESARVVFVCEHGSGTAPETTVPRSVREGLRGDGFVVSGFVPRLFTVSDAHEASLVVSFDQDVAKFVGGRTRYLRWDNLPGVLADYGRGRDDIVRHVDELIDELARSASP